MVGIGYGEMSLTVIPYKQMVKNPKRSLRKLKFTAKPVRNFNSLKTNVSFLFFQVDLVVKCGVDFERRKDNRNESCFLVFVLDVKTYGAEIFKSLFKLATKLLVKLPIKSLHKKRIKLISLGQTVFFYNWTSFSTETFCSHFARIA